MVDLVVGDYVLDNGLEGLHNAADKIHICDSEPSNYTDVLSKTLGNKNFGAPNVFGEPESPSPDDGRLSVSAAVTDGNVTADGTGAYWAAVDSSGGGQLLACGALNANVGVVSGQTFSLDAITVRLPAAMSSWNPEQLTNLIAWYKADIGLTTSGTNSQSGLPNITVVVDQSPAGNNLVGVSGGTDYGDRPSYVASSDYNGNPAFKFNANDNVGNCAGFASTGYSTSGVVDLPTTSHTITAWACGNVSSGANKVLGFGTGTDPDHDESSAAGNCALIQCGTAGAFGNGQGGYYCYTTFAGLGLPAAGNHTYIVVSDGTAVNTILYIDGVAGPSADTISPDHVFPSFTSPTNITFGMNWQNGISPSGISTQSIFCETGVAMTYSDADQVAQLHAYLVSKWGAVTPP